MERTQISTNRCVDKHNITLGSYRKEWSAIVSHHVDEFWSQYAKWKNPGTNVHILFHFIYINHKEEVNSKDKSRYDCQGSGILEIGKFGGD
jgi:hypothetical protein